MSELRCVYQMCVSSIQRKEEFLLYGFSVSCGFCLIHFTIEKHKRLRTERLFIAALNYELAGTNLSRRPSIALV